MIHQKAIVRKKFLEFPIPDALDVHGPRADDIAKLAYLLTLYTAPYDERRFSGFYIPFSARMGRNHFSKRWDAIRRISEQEYGHVFQWNNHYSTVFHFPKSVRLRAPYRTGECKLYTTVKKYNPIRHIDFDDLDAASRKLVNDFELFHLPATPPAFDNPWHYLTWASIHNKDFFAHRCQYGRFHSNFTAFKHRNMLTCEAGPLVEIDIRSAQMLCLASVLRHHYGKSPDIDKWLAICTNEDIYQFFANACGVSREEAKHGLIQCTFKSVAGMVKMEEFQAMYRNFPDMAEMLIRMKEESGYESVACRCQLLESRIVIDTAVPQLEGIPVVTIHDSLIVPVQYAATAKAVLASSAARYNLFPTFRVKAMA